MKKFWVLLIPVLAFSVWSCDDEKVEAYGDVDLQFVATYGNTPVVIGEAFDFDQGKIFFDKLRVYVTNVELSSDPGPNYDVTDVDVLDFTNNNTNATAAAEGVTIKATQMPVGGYQSVEFNVGLTNELNAMIPSDFPASHPLSNTEPYWADWESYIFVTISGRADLDNDGTFEQGFVYHVGGNSTRRSVRLSDRILAIDGQTVSSKINFDLEKVLHDANGTPFDIAAVSQVHTQVDIMEDFADRIQAAFSAQE
ncbi:MAG: hypothetical protein KDC24_02075 [Saprospiraceae bacterium]|nr:hypothetical protein [Saprospiraceae bacterium]